MFVGGDLRQKLLNEGYQVWQCSCYYQAFPSRDSATACNYIYKLEIVICHAYNKRTRRFWVKTRSSQGSNRCESLRAQFACMY